MDTIEMSRAEAPLRRRLRLPLQAPWAGWIGAVVVAVWVLATLLGPFLSPHDSGAVVGSMFAPISAAHPLGTDYLGRDMLSRILDGARYTLGVSLLAAVLASMMGTALGVLAAIRGGVLDMIMSRLTDALIAIPHLLFALVVVAALGTSLPVLIGLLAVSYTPGAFRIARSLALGINAMDFVQVARARGERTPYILFREILPNMLLPMLTDFGLRFVFAVLLLSGLSFLGLGIQPPHADWGSLVRENIEAIYEAAPAVLAPALAIASLTIGVNLLIDNLPRRRPGGEA
ncbi:MAG TPA: ABC transporter permease [Roseomonas sp.]|nr:ABC transporter permease [Roseomonas sp.]